MAWPRTSAATEPLGLVADLLYALGWALWTGVVVVVSVQAVPVLSDQVRAGSDQASEDDGAPTAKWQPD